jgi:phospholipid/cholesterol/gamma-HCH transport system permease protein
MQKGLPRFLRGELRPGSPTAATIEVSPFPQRELEHLPGNMANTSDSEAGSESLPTANPLVILQGIGNFGTNFLREVGSMFWFVVDTFDEIIDRVRQGRVPFRASSFFRHAERAGVDSVPLVGLVSFFLGLTMALLTGYQLQRFGTERLVPGLVAIGFTRELGPLLTGIMLAARIGAAFTAELGTMQVSEEVEAVEAMGIGPLRFLVAPRVLALVLLMPCLSTISNISAIFASSLVSRAYFSIAFIYFVDLVRDALLIRDIITGVLKSLMFGLLISAIACYRGLTVTGGAAGVGTATTSSVVTAITTVIGFDTLYNVVYTVFFPT